MIPCGVVAKCSRPDIERPGVQFSDGSCFFTISIQCVFVSQCFLIYHLFLLHVSLKVDLVTHCYVCLVFCGWDGWGQDGWVGFCL